MERRLTQACERGSFSREKKLEYERLMMNELDKINMVHQAEKRGDENGYKRGREEGREEGAMDKAIETARNLKVNGVDIALIAKCTGLTNEQVAELKPDE